MNSKQAITIEDSYTADTEQTETETETEAEVETEVSESEIPISYSRLRRFNLSTRYLYSSLCAPYCGYNTLEIYLLLVVF